MMMPRKLFIRRVFAFAALMLLAVLGNSPILAGVALPSGEPDANCPDLRLWLRADAGVRDAAGHGPADADFSGSVAVWSDQSARHFDLAAPPEQAPSYVAAPARGGQPADGRLRRRADAGAAQGCAARTRELDHVARLADPARPGARQRRLLRGRSRRQAGNTFLRTYRRIRFRAGLRAMVVRSATEPRNQC